MKRFIFFVLVFWSYSIVIGQTLSEERYYSEMKLGYTDGDFTMELGTFVPVDVKGAIQLPAEKMQKLKGCKITYLLVGIANKLTEQNNWIFITDNLEHAPLYEQKVDYLDVGWNKVKLDIPFEITGNTLYLGFRLTSQGDFLSMDGSEDNNLANWICIRENPEDKVEWGHQGGGCWNLQAIVEGNNLPQQEVALLKILSNQYSQAGGETPISLVVRNLAAAPIENMEVQVQVDDKDPVTFFVDSLNIQSNEVQKIFIGNYLMEEATIYNLNVCITKVNGVTDEEKENNSDFIENIMSKKNYRNRKVLVEHFSTMNCPNCPIAHLRIEKALKYRDNLIHVIHHSAFGTDPLTVPDSEKYLFFYTTGYTGGKSYAPGLMLDRTNMSRYGADEGSGNSTPGPAFFPRRENMGELMDRRLSTAALLTTNIKHTFNPENRELALKVVGDFPEVNQKKLDLASLRLTIFLTEDSISGKQAVSGKDYMDTYHSCVLRKVLTDTWGDSFVVQNEKYMSNDYTMDIPTDWNVDQLKIIAFISNYNSVDSNDCEVLNADEVDLQSDLVTAIDTPNDKERLTVYTIGKDLFVEGEFVDASVYQISGVQVLHFNGDVNMIPLHDLPNGMYIIHVNTKAGVVENFKVCI